MTMSKGIVALFSTSSRPVVPFVHLETGTTFSMPYVTTAPSVNSFTLTGSVTADVPVTGDVATTPVTEEAVTGSGHLSLHVRPLVHDAMLAVIHRHRWEVVYYLYDSDQGMSCYPQMTFITGTSMMDATSVIRYDFWHLRMRPVMRSVVCVCVCLFVLFVL